MKRDRSSHHLHEGVVEDLDKNDEVTDYRLDGLSEEEVENLKRHLEQLISEYPKDDIDGDVADLELTADDNKSE